MSTPPVIVDFKRGDTFEYQAAYTDADDVALSLAGITITSQVRDKNGAEIAELEVTITDEAGGLYSLLCQETIEWPVGHVLWDIQYSYGGRIVSTETIIVRVAQDVTQPTP